MKNQLHLLDRITRLIAESQDFHESVNNIVSLVREEMDTDVCSLYLYNEEKNRLVMVATDGLDKSAIGKVEMPPAEGLTGLVFESRTPLVVQDAHKHPRFLYFPVTKEETLKTYLGVPLISRRNPIGVLTVQDKAERSYNTQELQLFNTIAGQVAGVVVNARLLQELSVGSSSEPFEEPSRTTRILHGTAATPGIAMGPAIIMDTSDDFHYIVEERTDDPEREQAIFEKALEKARGQVEHLQGQVQQQLGEDDAAIFNIHLMMLEDQGFTQKVFDRINRGATALYAVKKVVTGYISSFEGIDDPYLRDRVVDIEDIGKRLIRLLSDTTTGGALHIEEEGVLITRLITPSDAASLSTQTVRGVATAGGGHTSHAIILSRSLGIPCVVGIEELLDTIHPNDYLIVDGNTGNVFVNPDDSVKAEYQRLMDDYNQHVVELVREKDMPAVTADGYKVELMANAGLLSDLKLISFYGADGIGLYRTELPFMARPTLPSEDEQFRIYRNMVEGASGKPVTIRTLDVGGDKGIPYLKFPFEENPYLGWRSIRMCLEKADIFKTQIRAIMRAGRYGPVAILIPMVGTMEEVARVKMRIEECRQELAASKVPCSPDVPVGIMIEVPSAAIHAGKFAKEVDFFSVGTNDLTQYTLAVDRNNNRVAHLYEPMNPAVLNLIAMTTKAARDASIPVAFCGEIASDPLWTPLLIGLGANELSMNASSIPVIRRSVRLLRREDCVKAARRAIRAGTAVEVRRILSRFEQMLSSEVLFHPSEH
jgi:phosphotransferase system enzyme I (PtsP)